VNGEPYVMERMGFGLSIAPKFLDIILKWIFRRNAEVDNYVDDLHVPATQEAAVVAELSRYGFTTKPAEPLSQARVLGLQLKTASDGTIRWSRRDGQSVMVPQSPTKRQVFSWCGTVIGHYPICGWLRPACSYLKRMACDGGHGWDEVVPDVVQRYMVEVHNKLKAGDPTHGVWNASIRPDDQCRLWCDASGIAYGVVLESGGHTIEDRSWLRKKDDTRHINVAELESVIKALTLATEWNVRNVQLLTDSKTVVGWLHTVLSNTHRLKTSGLHSVLVRQRLQIIASIVDVAQMSVDVQWVPSEDNRADELTRVPPAWVTYAKQRTDDVVATAPAARSVPYSDVEAAQAKDASIQRVIEELDSGQHISNSTYKKFAGQLRVHDGVLLRNFVDPVDGDVYAVVVPECLEEVTIRCAHEKTGHGNWECMWRSLNQSCFFPGMAAKCQAYVRDCEICLAANPTRGQPAPAQQNDIPIRPWDVIQIDTLELGPNQTGRYHCVLVCVDMFTRWVEVVPLRRHDGASVAEELRKICLRFGPPRVVRCDNGTEFNNAIVSSLLAAFGVTISTGAVWHPQSQGGAERFNRTLLTLIRKVLDSSDDWLAELDVLLFYYRTRPHSALRMSPMRAMFGWEARDLLIEGMPRFSKSAWVDDVCSDAARVRDYITELYAAHDVPLDDEAVCPYDVGDSVLLHRPARHQKRLAPYESGWRVKKVVGPATVVIAHGKREKVINVDQLKKGVALPPDPPSDPAVSDPGVNNSASATGGRDGGSVIWLPANDPVAPPSPPPTRYALRDRGSLHVPTRFQP